MLRVVILLGSLMLLSSGLEAAEKDLDETYEKEGSRAPWGGIFSQFFDGSGFGKSYAEF